MKRQQTIFNDPYIEGFKEGIATANRAKPRTRKESESKSPQKTIEPQKPEKPLTEPEKKAEANKELDKMLSDRERVLYRIRGIWPFDFFRDELIILRNQVDFVFREFFFSHEIQTISIKDITDVRLERGPIFATLKVVKGTYVSNQFELGYVWHKDAIRARHIIQALIHCQAKKIDVTVLSRNELLDKLEGIGTTQVQE